MGEFDHMTPNEALQWADKNCRPEAVERMRSRAAVAALAAEVRRMRHRIERLRGGLKSAAGWLLDADDLAGHERCLEMAGDMEPPLMGSNAELRGAKPTGEASRSNAELGRED